MGDKQDTRGTSELIARGSPHVREVIITYEKMGVGSNEDPIRRVLHVWTLGGELLAIENDPWNKSKENQK